MLEQRTLSSTALTYVTDQLEQGRTLSSLLLHSINLAGGSLWTFLPPTIEDDIANDLQYGRVAFAPARDVIFADEVVVEPVISPSRPLVVEFIKEFLTEAPDRYAIFEDALFSAKDPIIADAKGKPYFFYRDEVYSYASSRNTDRSVIDCAMESAGTYVLTGILTSLPTGSDFITPREEVSLQQLELLVSRTQSMVLQAYDGDGFVIWSRS